MAITLLRYISSVLYCTVTVFAIFLTNNLYSQPLPDEKIVEFNLPEASISEAIDALIENTGVKITYSPQDIPTDLRVTIVANHLELGIVLGDILSSTDLAYQIIGNQLVVFKDPTIIVDKKVRVSGYVEDKSSGERIVYANVFTDDY
ncbi:MAG: hypothetical protein P8M34_02305, partial [Saprospiraceae bacterium]|nr:hypothetical protein [Saprospiraceae bacterium]